MFFMEKLFVLIETKILQLKIPKQEKNLFLKFYAFFSIFLSNIYLSNV